MDDRSERTDRVASYLQFPVRCFPGQALIQVGTRILLFHGVVGKFDNYFALSNAARFSIHARA